MRTALGNFYTNNSAPKMCCSKHSLFLFSNDISASLAAGAGHREVCQAVEMHGGGW